MIAPALLTEHEVAARLACSVGLIRKLRARGEISYVRVGKAARFAEEHVAEFLARNTRVARRPALRAAR